MGDVIWRTPYTGEAEGTEDERGGGGGNDCDLLLLNLKCDNGNRRSAGKLCGDGRI